MIPHCKIQCGIAGSCNQSLDFLDTYVEGEIASDRHCTFRMAVGSRGPRSSRFLRLIPDPLLLDAATDDGDVNVIGGTFPCESIYNFECVHLLASTRNR